MVHGHCARSHRAWNKYVPILLRTLATIPIKGPVPLNVTKQVINGVTPTDSFERGNPVMLIRAVNHLQAMGKEKAIAELQEFLTIAMQSSYVKRDPADIDTSDRLSVLPIFDLLFDPAAFLIMDDGAHYEGTERIPLEDHWRHSRLGGRLVAVQDDFPFYRTTLFAGSPGDPKWNLDQASRYGKIRPRFLHPADNPLTAADKLGSDDGSEIRDQACRAIASLVRVPMDESKLDDAAWQQLKEAAAKRRIRWDVVKQEYVTDGP